MLSELIFGHDSKSKTNGGQMKTLKIPVLLSMLACLSFNLCGKTIAADDDEGAATPQAKDPAWLTKSTATQAKSTEFQLGNLTDSTTIPGTFGPFSARTSAVGIYRGRLQVNSDDLSDNKFLVVRVQNDKTHRFGWIRCFVGNQLVANEGSIKDNRIVADISRQLKPGDVTVTLMGMAYPGTACDFYVVPKDTVLTVLQGMPLGNIIYSTGAIPVAAKGPETLEKSFDMAQAPDARLILTVKAANGKGKPYAWVRAFMNGTPVMTEQNFTAGEGSIDVSSFVRKGSNRVDVQTVAAPGSVFGWYLTQLSKVGASSKSAIAANSKSAAASGRPSISKIIAGKITKGGDTIEILGRGLDSSTKVFFDDREVTPKTVRENFLIVELPKDLISGSCRITLGSGGQRSEPHAIFITGVPKVSSVYPKDAVPGKELEIRGENFSEKQADLKVEIGSQSARILTSSRQRILVLVPNLETTTEELPLKVSVGGVNSTDAVSLRLSSTTE